MPDNQPGSCGRVIYFDALNVLACFGVVAMHVNGLTHNFRYSLRWVQALSVDCLFYWAVPVFFMLSGATLLGYRSRYSTRDFLKKRFMRTFVPFLSWSLITYAWLRLTGQSETLTLSSLLEAIINNKLNSRYWFFAPLFAAYLCIPVLSLVAENKRVLEYAIGAGFLVNIAAPFAAGLVGLAWNGAFALEVVGGYLLYLFVGYWLANNEIPRRIRLLIYVLAVALTAYRFFGTVLASYDSGSLVKIGWGYNSVPAFVESVAVFVLVKSLMARREVSGECSQLLSRMAACSFGVYLVHSIVIWHIQALTGFNGLSNVWRLGGPAVVYLVCLALVWLGRKPRKLWWLFP